MYFSLPNNLPSSLDPLSSHGPYLRYKLHICFKRFETLCMNIERDFRIIVKAAPSPNSHPTYLSPVVANKNRSEFTVYATLSDRRGFFAPGDNVLLNLELRNPNHNTISSLSIYLVQHRHVGIGGHCKQTVAFADVPHLRGFSIENFRDTVQLRIPDDYIIPSFYYMTPRSTTRPIVVTYMLRIKAKINGLFNDFILDLPIRIHSMEIYNEEEAPPPPYEVAIARL